MAVVLSWGDEVDWDAWPFTEDEARAGAAALARRVRDAGDDPAGDDSLAGGDSIRGEDGSTTGDDPMARAAALAGRRVICEATFAHDGDLCMADLLLVEPAGVRLVEVKSSTHVRDVYLHDMAFQCWVLGACGYRVESASLMHVDGSYVREGDVDLRGLFAVEDRTAEVRALVAEVGERAAFLKAVADADDEPAFIAPDRGADPAAGPWALADDAAGLRSPTDIGPHCTRPYPCGYRAWCWRDVPRPGGFDLSRWSARKAFGAYDGGVATFGDVARAAESGALRLSAVASRQVRAWEEGAGVLADPAALRRFLDGLGWPLAFLDFETFQQAVPPLEGTRPYEQIPTQFSLHVLAGPDAPLEHREFLAEPGGDPRRALAEALVAAVPEGACVLAYNMSFEKAVIRGLAESFPDLAGTLMAIHDAARDLMAPFQSGACYAAAQGGSLSIKAVLPALFPDDLELDYHALPGPANGGEAVAAFGALASLPPEEVPAARAALLAYCRLDTLAMVRIWERLRELAEE